MIRRMELMRGPARLAMAGGGDPHSRSAMILAYTARHREWLEADHVRCRLRHEIGELFDRYDAILAPITPLAAFPHDHRPFEKRRLTLSTGEAVAYTHMLDWIGLPTALHLPSTAVPAGLTPAGLPVGAQLIGPLGGDAKTLALAQAIDETIRGFVAPPI
jgi:amidase